MMKRPTELLYRDAWAKRVGKLPPGEVLPEVPGLIKTFPTEITFAKEPDPETGMTDIKFVISTGAMDRDDDVIDVNGWDLDNYKKNPVVLFGHNYQSLPVAKAMEVGIEDDQLLAVDRFTPQEVNPFGYMVYRLVKGKFLRATSVGFRPRTYVFNDDHKGYDFNEQELLEHSIVPVPSNPEALEAASAEGIDLLPYKEWAETILDGGPDGDSVALWLPKEVVTSIHASLSHVAVSLTDTSTGEGVVTGDATTEGGTELVPATPTVADISLDYNMEDDMELADAIQALSDVVRELNQSVDKLPEEIAVKVADSVAEKLADSATEKDPPEGEGDDGLTEDDVKAIVAGAVESVLTAATGQLPD